MRYLLFIILVLPLTALCQSKDAAPAKEIEKTPVIRITCSARAVKDTPLITINGYLIDQAKLQHINPSEIAAIDITKGAEAISRYGEKAKFGVIHITVKSEALKQLIEQRVIKPIL